MSDIFLTSDTHFFHDKPFIYEARGFKNVEEMNEKIIENWNAVVKDDDIIYHLGDVFLNAEPAQIFNLFKRLKGIKYLAFGNHDTKNRLSFFEENCFFKEINMGYRLKAGKKTLILSHCPQLVANKEDKKPVWSIHGHTHSFFKFSDVPNTYNVGIEAQGCKPVNIEDIILDIRNQKEIVEHLLNAEAV